ncbi:hypothetical protein GBAR_LOCUS14732 [Geodia barretti]|uniref:Uncharacterized protein n=1 Tax=Geodia barretti TaxID=519541 RepID=A0AA35WL59_GEOBA|nr:hypothetical protein GBAR_LOCUS14732 [Geodia barretti]
MVYPGLQMNIPAFYPMQSGHYQHTSIALNHGYSAQNCNCTIMVSMYVLSCLGSYTVSWSVEGRLHLYLNISSSTDFRLCSKHALIAREYAVLLC